MEKDYISEEVGSIAHIRTWEDIKRVFGDRVENLPQINNKFKQGDYGRLWKIKGQPLSLKITTDKEEMKLARRLKGQSLSGFLEIYEIVDLPKHKHNGKSIPPLQLRIQELCYPIKELIPLRDSTELEVVMTLLRGNFESIKNVSMKTPQDVEVFYDALEIIKEKDAGIKSVTSNKNLQKTLEPIIIKFVDLLKRIHKDLPDLNLREDVDIHDENIMMSKNKIWKLVDF